MAPAGLLNSFVAAIQASLSVLLVISYGILAARWKLLDSASGRAISKVCVKLFLPALLFTKIGAELHAGSAQRYGVILLWAFICHFVSFLIGFAAHIFLGMPDWITAAIMFNNTTSYPLLLIQSLSETGLLEELTGKDETILQAIERAKSYFLVFATVSSCLTFAVGPRLIDSEHTPDPVEDDKTLSDDEEDAQPSDTTALLQRERQASTISLERRAYGMSARRWLSYHPQTRWWLLFIYDFFNAPLLGAVAGAVVGLVPVLHRAFFNDTNQGGIFTAWLTQSLKSIGSLFVPLPVVIAGVSLATSMKSEHASAPTPWANTLFILFVRFVLWSAASISIIWAIASKTQWLGDDPMLWFAMMLMPTGPPAMKLIAMVQVSGAGDEDETKIAKLLAISYAISPMLAITVVGSLRASLSAV